MNSESHMDRDASASPDRRARTASTDASGPDGHSNGRHDPAPGSLLTELAALSEFATHMLSARFDELRLKAGNRLRAMLISAAASVAVVAIGAAVILISAAYLMEGLSGALAELLGGRTWAGRLGTGAIGVGLILGAIYWRERSAVRTRLKRRILRYELRRARQRARFGRDIGRTAN